MAKDSYWFRHDSTAGRGLRMRKMAHIYGHWGKGIYWDVIEILRDQSNYCFNSDDSSLQLLSDLIGCKDEPKFISWFKDCVKLDLFQVIDNKFISQILCENMERWEKSKDDGSKGGNPNFKKGEPNPYYKPKDKGKDNPIDKGKDKHNSIVYNKEDIYRSFKHLSLSNDEFNKLIKDGYSKTQIDTMIDSIQNYKKNKNYESLNLTIRSWFNKNNINPALVVETLEQRAIRLRTQ